MTRTLWAAAAACVSALAMSASMASAQEAHRFAPLTPDKMTPAQLAVPSVAKAVAAGNYNPNGYDAVMLREPGLSDAIGAVVAKTYPGMARMSGVANANPPTVPKGLVEMGILMLSYEWRFPAMFPAHGPGAVKEGVSQETVDAISRGERPAHMQPDQAAVYDLLVELLHKHEVSDAAFAGARKYLSERDMVDLVTTIGVYTNSLMILKISANSTH